MDNPLILNFTTITIFVLMLAIGINLSFEELLSFYRQPRLLLPILLAVVLLVPLLVFVLLSLFDLPSGVVSGLVLLAATPGAPLMTKRSVMAGGNFFYSASLQFILALSIVFVTPITLAIFYSFFDLQIDRIGFLRVIQQVFEVQFIPLTIGLFIQKFIPQVASIISQPLILIADFLFLLLIALAIVPSFLLIESMNIQSQIVILIMVVISLSIGHFLGGSEVEKRATLAIACIARNIGLAIYIAILNDAQKEVIPTLISYAIWGALIAIPYSFWSKRQIAK